MKLLNTLIVIFTTLLILAASILAQESSEFDYSNAIQKIGEEIFKLKNEFPQLNDFIPNEHVDIENLKISYGYKTHSPTHSGGWTAGVPNPDPEGIWFYIDFHDQNSTRQIHTQPVAIPAHIGNKSISFLILEGTKTKSVRASIWNILKNNGVKIKNLKNE